MPANLASETVPAETIASKKRLNLHFRIDTMGGVGYTYIRKNACSAFKRMILETSNAADKDPDRFDHPSKFMGRYHKLTPAQMAKQGMRIVVLRDPIERIISGYVNLFLMRLDRPMLTVHRAIEEFTSKPASAVNFEMFIRDYLAQGNVDEHYAPQEKHLAPLHYSHVLDTDNLYSDTVSIFGERLAKRYFARPRNSTAHLSQDHDPDAYRRTVGELFNAYKETGKLPTKEGFLTDQIREELEEIYKDDVEIWNRYQGIRADAGNIPVPIDASL